MKLSSFLILDDVYASRPKAHYNTRLVFDH